jgi:hypothetical protein
MGYQPIDNGYFSPRDKVEYFSNVRDGVYLGLRLLKPTGKWRIRFDIYEQSYKIDLQHKGFFFKRWICEDEIYLRNPPLNIEFDCNKK